MTNQLPGSPSYSMAPPKSVPRLLIVILLVAAVLRLWGINYGLPYEGITYDQLTWEEVQEVHRALKLGAGEYSWSFGKGGLYLLLFVEYGIYFVVSWLFGWVSSARDFAIQIVQDRTAVYMIGRLTVLLLGMATYLVIYSLGKRLYDWRVGLTAALIGATAYLHGVFSTVINVDIGMTFALWSSILVYTEYERTQKQRYLVGAGILGAVAIAFKLPGAVILPILFMAIVSAQSHPWRSPIALFKQGAIVFLSLLVALTLIAPEWIPAIGPTLGHQFSNILGSIGLESSDYEETLNDSIAMVTVLRSDSGFSFGYVEQLLRGYNIGLTIAASLGVGLAIWNRHRWDIIWSVFVIVFVLVMSLSDRTQSQHYLLPIYPAMWLLASHAVVQISKIHRAVLPTSVALIVIPSLISLVRHDVEKMNPDTRVIAKEWIEANVPRDAKILLDGMQYRLIPSPPLNPNRQTLERQIERAGAVGERLGRGVSDLALSVYQEALQKIEGPSFDIYSTTYGLEVESLSYYAENCFDYVVTSSYITERYEPGQRRRELYPNAAQFYDSLKTDPRFRVIYEMGPIPWRHSGPTITVYEVNSGCNHASQGQVKTNDP